MRTARERELALDRAATHHRNARRHVEFQLTAMSNATMYFKMIGREDANALEPDEVDRRIKACNENAARFSRLESAALRLLNEALLDAGHEPSDVVEVERHLYGVANPGLLAVHLGQSLPTDDELAHSFEPVVNARDDAAEDRDTFADATRAFFG